MGFLYPLHVHAKFATSSSFRSSFLQQMSQPHLQTTSLSIVDLPQGFQSHVESMKDTRQKLLSMDGSDWSRFSTGKLLLNFVHRFKGKLFPTSWVWPLARVTLVYCWVGPGLYRLYPTFIIQQLWNVHLYTFHQHSLMEEISKSYTSWSLKILIWKASVFGFDTASQVVRRISINFRSINSRERSAPKNLLDIRWSVSHHPQSSKADRYVVAPGHLCA